MDWYDLHQGTVRVIDRHRPETVHRCVLENVQQIRRLTLIFLCRDWKTEGIAPLHAETRFGEAVNLDAVGLAPVNANMLYPSLDNTTAITGLQILQAINKD